MAVIRPTIGTETFITLRGPVVPLAERVETLKRKGLSGSDFRRVGKGALPFTVETMVDVSSTAGAKTKMLAYAALCGTLVTVKDDLGNQWTNVMVLNVRATEHSRTGTAVGGVNTTPAAIVRATWEMQATE